MGLIVNRRAREAGLDPNNCAGHSLRSGLATGATADVTEQSIIAQTGRKSLLVVRRYIREGSLFRSKAAAALGLEDPGPPP